MERIEEAVKLCAAFSRSMNYPKTDDGCLALARGLIRAERMTGIVMERIVDECLQSSMYCPTDADLLNVARDIRGPLPAEDIPAPRAEQVRKQWQSHAAQFPRIKENGKLWHANFAKVCAKVRQAMGDRWMTSTSSEKVRVAIELGLPVLNRPAPLEECGLGIFVERIPL